MNLALLENNIVTNIIWVTPEQQNEFLNSVAIDGLPVQIGDTYKPETQKFYRNDQEVSWNMKVEPAPEPEPQPQLYTLNQAAEVLAQEVSKHGYNI